MHKQIKQLLLSFAIAFFIVPIKTDASSTTFLIEGKPNSFHAQQIDYLKHVDLTIIETDSSEPTLVEALSPTMAVFNDSKRTISQSFQLPFYDQKWHIKQFNYKQAWAYEPLRPVKIAIIDTGVSSELLQDNRFTNGKNFVNTALPPIDDNGHGTALASVTLDVIGPYPVQIVPIKAADLTGSFSVSNIVKAIDYAMEQQVDIINLSFGAKNPHDAEQQAINKAIEAGIDVFSASGNSGRKEYFYPAAYPNVISVGAINNELTRASFSTYNDAIDFVAPGTNLNVLRHDKYSAYTTIDGTSFATAYLTGQYAILKANSLQFEAVQLPKFATDLGLAGYDNEYGYGMLETDKVLEKIRGKTWQTRTTTDRQKTWTIQLNKSVNTTHSLKQHIKIYNAALIEQPTSINILSNRTIEVTPTTALSTGEYWLTIDAELQAKSGQQLKQPAIVKFIIE